MAQSSVVTADANYEPAFDASGASWVAAYGLGWDVAKYAGRKTLRHTGCWRGTRTAIHPLPSAGFGVVVLSNRGSCGGPMQLAPGALAMRSLDAYLGKP